MIVRRILLRIGIPPWAIEVGIAALALLVGIGVMPVLIFYVGVAALGAYEGASLARLYHSLFAGLGQASIAAWIVFVGPYGLYLLFKALGAWWGTSKHLT